MFTPSTKYLYGRTSTFGASVNVTAADHAAVDAEIAAERTAFARRQLGLAPEVFPYASVEIIPAEVTVEQILARLTDSVPDCPTCDGYAFVGHVCPGELDADQDEECGSRCSRACGYCGMCS